MEKGVYFVSGTVILTNNGLKSIDSITTDDIVWTYNVETKETELNSVPNIFKRSSFEFVRVWYGGDSVTCTHEHPFFENDGWVAAKDLRQGDSLFAFSGTKLRIDSVYQFKTDTATAVYNLEVAGNSNYYVSASGVLVHNCETKLLGSARNNLLNAVTNPKLRNIISDLYRSGAKIGSGSSMDAYRLEKLTGGTVGGKLHMQKLIIYRKGLLNVWKNRSQLNSMDRQITKQLLQDIQNALSN